MRPQKWTLALLATLIVGLAAFAAPAQASRTIFISTSDPCTCTSGDEWRVVAVGQFTKEQDDPLPPLTDFRLVRWGHGDLPYTGINFTHYIGQTWDWEFYSPWEDDCPNGEQLFIAYLKIRDGEGELVTELQSNAVYDWCN